MLQELGTWEVSARLDGEEQLAGLFTQMAPEDAVALLLVPVRVRFGVHPSDWQRWLFVCVLRDTDGTRTVVFTVDDQARLTRRVGSVLH
jgi:hypothetical protein